MFRKIIGAAAALAFAGMAGTANANFIASGAFESNGSLTTVDRIFFEVSATDTIEITLDTDDDAEMNLRFSDAAFGIGAFIENDDDDGAGLDSFISRSLDPGFYVVIAGLFSLPNNAIGPVNPDNEAPSTPYTLTVTGSADFSCQLEGTLNSTFSGSCESNEVPEPSALALLGAGLLGLSWARRRRKAARS